MDFITPFTEVHSLPRFVMSLGEVSPSSSWGHMAKAFGIRYVQLQTQLEQTICFSWSWLCQWRSISAVMCADPYPLFEREIIVSTTGLAVAMCVYSILPLT